MGREGAGGPSAPRLLKKPSEQEHLANRASGLAALTLTVFASNR
jgi:hypothetical protein